MQSQSLSCNGQFGNNWRFSLWEGDCARLDDCELFMIKGFRPTATRSSVRSLLGTMSKKKGDDFLCLMMSAGVGTGNWAQSC